ncbi:MAG: hypothetical protein IT553_01285 [Sphingomonadaceae bacterium]|nr:hypothetical protein [Sphingomonadaceae bacterium]
MVDDGRTMLRYDQIMAVQQGTMAGEYRGIAMLKNPYDLALYTRLIGQLRPATVIEVGSHRGGSAIWFADQMRCHAIAGAVHSIDIARVDDVSDPMVTFHGCDACQLGPLYDRLATLPHPWLVVEDADHMATTTRAVMDFFHPLLHIGDWLVVEDGILTAMGVAADYGGGPLQAIDGFLGEYGAQYHLRRDYCDWFGRNVTWNVDGWLERVA